MQQVTGLDELFLCIDAGPASNAVIGHLLLLSTPEDPDSAGLDRVRARLEERLPGIPPLRRVASGLPVGINNTYLREVDVDIAAHVREVVLSLTGEADLADLAAGVAAVMEEPLPAHRPLWELVVLRGLAGGGLAHLFRVHHGIVDGPTLPIVLDLLSDHPQQPPQTAPPPLAGRRLPEFVDLLARGVVNSALTPVRLLSIQGRTVQYLLGRTKYEGALALPAYLARMLPGGLSRPLSALVNGHQRMIGGTPVRPLIPAIQMQKTPFNGKLTERRSYVFSELSADDVARAAARFQVTGSDVVVAACAGGLRRYMQRYGEVPDRPLILCMPASIRTGQEKEPWATHLSMLFAEFPTNVDDPTARVRLVHDELTAARGTFDALPMHILRDASRLMPLTMLNVSMKLLNRAPEWAPGTPWNVVVASVPLRSEPMKICGAAVVGQWPVGFLTPGVGLNFGVYSSGSRVAVGICGCPDLMPDLGLLSDYVTAALGEMMTVAQAIPAALPDPRGARPPRRSPPAKPTPRRPRVRDTAAPEAAPQPEVPPDVADEVATTSGGGTGDGAQAASPTGRRRATATATARTRRDGRRTAPPTPRTARTAATPPPRSASASDGSQIASTPTTKAPTRAPATSRTSATRTAAATKKAGAIKAASVTKRAPAGKKADEGRTGTAGASDAPPTEPARSPTE